MLLRRWFVQVGFGISTTTALLLGVILGGDAGAQPASPRVPPAKPLRTTVGPGVSTDRVILKLREGTDVRLRAGGVAARSAVDVSRLEAALASHGIAAARFERLFPRTEAELGVERERGRRRSGRELADLTLYYAATLPPGVDLGALCDALNALPFVELAYPAPRPEPPPVDIAPPTPDFSGAQGYRGQPPAGIGALDGSIAAGADGAGTALVDIEYDWTLDHEDLELPPTVNIDPATLLSPYGTSHGTAVLGVIGALGNGYGVTGIAPAAALLVAPALTAEFGYNLPRAINLATGALAPGDAILLEQQTTVCAFPTARFGPVEWDPATFDAISLATSLGIVVVEAAGNGAANLDDPSCAGRFDRSTRDSGAIVVGAGVSTSRERASFSSYGSRVDLQGWGNSVTTSGYGGLFDPGGDVRQQYTGTFSGTSSASAIVTGAALAVQGTLRARGLAPLDPVDLRALLVDTGTPQVASDPPAEHIGPLPSIPHALARILAPPNDGFDRAIPAGAGTLSGTLENATPDGAASLGLPGQPDVWYAYTAPVTGTFRLDSCGTHDAGGLDTVLSVHASGPGTAANELAVNDDWPLGSEPTACEGQDQGAQRDSALRFFAAAGQRVLLRVARRDGSSGGTGEFGLRLSAPAIASVPVKFEQVRSGAATGAASVATAGSLAAAPGDLYLAAVAIRRSGSNSNTVRSVSGLGLAWSEVVAQCGGRNQSLLSIWIAQGAPTGSGAVSASFAAPAAAAAIAVSRYSGVDPADPIGAIVAGNPNGVAGACSGGTDGASWSFGLPVTGVNGAVFGAATMRAKTQTPGPGLTERVELVAGSGGDATSLATEDQSVAAPGSIPVGGTLSGVTDWAAVALELRAE
jgi:hypothetical protein